MSFITDIRDFIASDSEIESVFGSSITFATNLFISFEKDSPNDCITIYPTPGRKPTSRDKYISSIQVRVRSSDFLTGYNTCQKIIDRLHLNGSVLSNSNGMLIALSSNPNYVFKDHKRRSIFTANFNSKHVKY